MGELPPDQDYSKNNDIDVIVVGAGYAGLACAIELKRKGCNVHLIEREPSLQILGQQTTTGQFGGLTG